MGLTRNIRSWKTSWRRFQHDRFEQVLDELESLQAQLPKWSGQIQTGKEKLQEIRQEKD